MQAARTPLPEFEHLRNQQPPTPMRWPRNIVSSETARQVDESAVEFASIGDDLALRGCPGTELTLTRP